jgi:hypothetical protein
VQTESSPHRTGITQVTARLGHLRTLDVLKDVRDRRDQRIRPLSHVGAALHGAAGAHWARLLYHAMVLIVLMKRPAMSLRGS